MNDITFEQLCDTCLVRVDDHCVYIRYADGIYRPSPLFQPSRFTAGQVINLFKRTLPHTEKEPLLVFDDITGHNEIWRRDAA